MKKIYIIIVVLLTVLVIFGFVYFKTDFNKSEISEMPVETIKTEAEIKVEEKNEPTPQFIIEDQDRDGILDAEEEALGLSNRDFDTDGDGLSDKAEIDKWGTDPTNSDTDGDGYWDGFEIIKGYNPNGEGKL